jgi:hypothetical protein
MVLVPSSRLVVDPLPRQLLPPVLPFSSSSPSSTSSTSSSASSAPSSTPPSAVRAVLMTVPVGLSMDLLGRGSVGTGRLGRSGCSRVLSRRVSRLRLAGGSRTRSGSGHESRRRFGPKDGGFVFRFLVLFRLAVRAVLVLGRHRVDPERAVGLRQRSGEVGSKTERQVKKGVFGKARAADDARVGRLRSFCIAKRSAGRWHCTQHTPLCTSCWHRKFVGRANRSGYSRK